jgi:acyl-CoA synthetase (AMP-forming)/AMP-acid ligase II
MPLSGPPLAAPIPLTPLLRRGLEAGPDETALASAEDRLTWRELDRVSSRLALNLLGLGLRPGDRVASLMPNRTALIIHYLACMKAGLVATPLNYRYTPPEIDHALEVSGAAILLAHAEREADLAASRLAGQLPRGVIRYGVPGGTGPAFQELVDREPPAGELPVPDPAAPAVIFFTSGSTGLPKGVTHTFETFGWVLAGIAEGLELTPADRVLTGSSLSHVAAMSFGLGALAAGARHVIPRTFDGDEMLPLLREERPTVLVMLPAPLFVLERDHGAQRDDFRSIRLLVSGGDKVPAELEREFTALSGFPIDEGYGMTETGTVTINPPTGPNKLGSIGKLCPGVAASIRDDAGAELGADQEGRLWVRSPSNMIGYWNNAAATEATIRDGWLDTGDVMRADAGGYFWFCGRRKQIIIHDGSNICPQEVEEALLEHPAVACAGIVGVHDLVHGENVRAYVTLKEGVSPPTSQALIRFARARVGYKAPEEIVVLPEMPLNATGKVDRVALKQLAEARLAGAPASGAPE